MFLEVELFGSFGSVNNTSGQIFHTHSPEVMQFAHTAEARHSAKSSRAWARKSLIWGSFEIWGKELARCGSCPILLLNDNLHKITPKLLRQLGFQGQWQTPPDSARTGPQELKRIRTSCKRQKIKPEKQESKSRKSAQIRRRRTDRLASLHRAFAGSNLERSGFCKSSNSQSKVGTGDRQQRSKTQDTFTKLPLDCSFFRRPPTKSWYGGSG